MYSRTLPYKTKQFFFVLIKLSIVFGALYFIYNKLASNEELDFSVFIDFMIENDVFSFKNVTFLLFLTIFNWFFEILKWQNLVSFVKNISFKEAFEQSLGSLTASLITPNRIGEYGVKAAYFSKSYRKRVLLLNLIGNISQMTITVLFGAIGLYMFIQTYNVEVSYYRMTRLLLIFVFILAFSMLGIKQNKFRIKGFSFKIIIDYIKDIPSNILSKTILFSLIRYLVFSYQFYFLLGVFGYNLPYLNAMVFISSMYLLASVVPTISIFDVVIKGCAAVYVFSFIDVNDLAILSIITIMWILNFVFPSIFGSYYVINFSWYNPDSK